MSKTKPQPTKAAKHLIDAVWQDQENFRLSLQTMETDMKVLAAHSLDDAGVREAVEACEKMADVAESKENVTVRLVALEALAHRALTALTGDKP